MNCPKCNAVLPEGSKFCEECGTRIEPVQGAQQMPPQGAQQMPPQGAQQMPPQGAWQVPPAQGVQQPHPAYQTPVQQSSKKPLDKKLVAMIAGIGGAAVLAIIVLLVVVFTHKKKINLRDYTEVKFSGYDTYGTAYIDFDEEAFMKDIQDKAKNVKGSGKNLTDSDYDWSDLASDLSGLGSYYVVCEGLDYSLDKSEGLSNGDTVTVSYKFDNDNAKKYGIKFVGDDYEFKVSGLDEIREVDPFADLSVEFTGTAPDVYVEVNNNSSDEGVSSLYFTAEPSSGISKGDTVTVTVDDYDEESLIQNYGCKLTSTSKEYTCESVDEYISDGSQVGTDILEQMKTQTSDKVQAYFAGESDIEVSDLSYEGYYFLAAKNTDSYGNKNKIIIVYSGTVKSVAEEKQFDDTKVYFPVRFGDVIKYQDGTDYVDLNYADGILGSTSLSYGWFGTVRGYDNESTMKNELVIAEKSDYQDSVFGNLK